MKILSLLFLFSVIFFSCKNESKNNDTLIDVDLDKNQKYINEDDFLMIFNIKESARIQSTFLQ